MSEQKSDEALDVRVPADSVVSGESLSSLVVDELLDPEIWRDPLGGYTQATKLSVMMVNQSGAPVGPCIRPHRIWEIVTERVAPAFGRCTFCIHPRGTCTALADSQRTGSITFTRDRSGLAHAVVPVRLGGHALAYLLVGQVFDRFPEQLLLEDLARATASPPQTLWEIARHDVPVGRTLLHGYAQLLQTLAESYVHARHAGIVERKYYAEILGLHDDLNQRKAIEAALREADRRKDQFLAMLAHELRNPLAPMMTAVHLLELRGDGQTSERALTTMKRQLHHLVRLVDDLLDFSRITRGQIGLQRHLVTVADVIASAVETSRPEIDQRRHRLTVKELADALWVDVDAVRISQAVSNLLNNAARYMDPGGEIRLSVEQASGQAVISVADRGYGIPADLIASVFDMFVRGSSSAATAPGGLGIGLALTKAIVEMHEGRISAVSEGPNCGSTFTIQLPLSPRPTSAAAVTRSHTPTVASRASSWRILIVEDNRDARELLSQALVLKGHDVKCAGDGESALDIARVWRPEAVILDIGLPGVNGHEVARRLRERSELGSPVLIALTGWGQERDRKLSAAAGIDHHLTKPLDPTALHELLQRLAKRD